MVAASAPRFMTLFGRDSLWASVMALPVDPSLALGALQTLAAPGPPGVDHLNEEEPGKILHEVRLDVSSGLALGGKSAYYGSVDATALFLMVLGEVSRWGFSKDTIAALQPHAERALDWIRDYGDRDGDGFLKHQFKGQFWLPVRGYYAIALDRHKKPVDACASNMGHCLARGIGDQEGPDGGGAADGA